MATNNAVNTTLEGQSGTGAFAGTNGPTFVGPILGAASATSMAFTSTTGIIGTATNDSAAVGSVGELISSVIQTGSAIAITTTLATNLTSISLTAGDWDVWGNLTFLPAATTNIISWIASINTVSATMSNASLNQSIVVSSGTVPGPGGHVGAVAPPRRVSLSATTTYYLVGFTAFSVSTMTFCGGIYARRVR